MEEKRKSKWITDKDDIEKFLNIMPKEDYNRTFIMETFGDFGDGPKYNPYDLIKIPPGYFGKPGRKNKNTFVTTIGLWVFNKFFIEPNFVDVVGYISTPVNKKTYGKINDILATALLEDKITVEQLKEFITYSEFIMPFVSILSPNDSIGVLTISDTIADKKKELIEKNKDAIEKGDAYAVSKMEKELIDTAIDKLKDDPALDSYTSGSRASIGNNFKNIYVMKGAIRDPITNEFNIATSCYADGMSPEEYHIFANSLAAGPFSRTNNTKRGGYWEKLFVAAFQHLYILPDGSDCHTKRYVEVTLNDPSVWMYSYMIEGDKLVQLTSKNVDKYRGKKVKFRYASMCEAEGGGYCSVCAGGMIDKLGMKNIGLALPLIPSKLKNIAMKAFHDSTQSFYHMDPTKAFGFDGTKRIERR